MKKIVLSFMLFFSLNLHAQNDTTGVRIDPSKVKFIEPSDSTAIGTPAGNPASKQIGPAGGTIVSEDGRLELIFPAGALTSNTTISIQPTTNLAPNGTGQSYQFEPSGIQFKKPVRINFHYTDEEAEAAPADLMGLAMQDHNGKWSFIEYDDWDSTSKILKGFIRHFSGVSNVYKLKMVSNIKSVCAEDHAFIKFIDLSRFFGPGTGSIAGHNEPGVFSMGQPILWYVEGIENGNARVGQVTGFLEQLVGKEALAGATFTAPSVMPQKNPVTVKADIYVNKGKGKVYSYARSLRCQFVIYDRYIVKVSHAHEYRAAMGNEVTDSATFIVSVFPQNLGLIITDIKHYTPTVTKEGKARAGCKLKIYPEEGTNSIYISEAYKNYVLNNDYPPDVLFEFPPATSEQVYFKWQCAGKFPTAIIPFSEMPLEPVIEFVANGLAQKAFVNNGQYEVSVRPHRIAMEQ